VTDDDTLLLQVWTSTALSEYGSAYGLIAVVAETREEAITKASAELGAINSVYIPEQKYVRALLENLHEMSEDGDVVIHWDAIRQRS
jgi:hypothetical protein